MTTQNAFAAALHAAGPFSESADKLALYGFLAGSWTFHAKVQTEPGRFVEADGEMHCGWILGGRALQEVWHLPGHFYGTILRIYDPGLDAWHILWIEPVDQYYPQLIGRAVGKDIVQMGKNKSGQDMRWSFTEITADSFRWIGEVKNASGWFLHRDMKARRVRTADCRQPVATCNK